MTPLIVLLLAAGPCVYWTGGPESRAILDAASVKRLCVAADQVGVWKAAGFTAVAVNATDVSGRTALPAPGVAPRAGVASPTRSPFIVAGGWRVLRAPTAKYAYTLPAGKGVLGAAEAFAYGADAALTIDPADLPAVSAMLAFFDTVPKSTLPPLADFGLVDDGSDTVGEVLNLLVRRNLLARPVPSPSNQFPLNVTIGSPQFPRQEAADPSAIAQRVRSQLTDERRSLRVFGSEVVIARVLSDGKSARLHLINYGGREIEGLRIRIRGRFQDGAAYVPGTGRVTLADYSVLDDATEFSLPRIATYAVIDLQ
jgi:hypothetical protein